MSTDLVNWEALGTVIAPGDVGQFDETATWTGCVVADPVEGWRMFYTGSVFHERHNIETIGSAVSRDLSTWTKQPAQVLAADPRWYEIYGDSKWPEEAWRDPCVFAEPAGNGWHMLITARSNTGADNDRGVVGHAMSDNLRDWVVMPPLSEPDSGFAHIEVTQVATIGGRHTLIFSCALAEHASNGPFSNEPAGIWAVEIQSLAGPFPIHLARPIKRGPLYSGRIVQDRCGNWVMLAFDTVDAEGLFPRSISDPIPLSWTEEGLELASATAIVDA